MKLSKDNKQGEILFQEVNNFFLILCNNIPLFPTKFSKSLFKRLFFQFRKCPENFNNELNACEIFMENE